MMHLDFSAVRRRLHARVKLVFHPVTTGLQKQRGRIKKLGIAISRLDDQLIL
jgi:hypothetical protein